MMIEHSWIHHENFFLKKKRKETEKYVIFYLFQNGSRKLKSLWEMSGGREPPKSAIWDLFKA